jgi:lipopolysaccharide biosynthesis glycosyltransferase
MASIVRNAPGARLRFIVLHDGISAERQACMERVAPEARFHWAEIGDHDVPAYASNGTHFSRAILFRLGLERLAPRDCMRVLYLDADVIVLGDLRALWRSDLEGAPLGAMLDSYRLDGGEFAQKWGLPPSPVGYFNSGVLLIDLERVRADRLFSAAIDLVQREGARFRFADQDALNIATWARWRPLPPAWNAQRDMVIPVLAERLPPEMRFHDRLPSVVHYTGPEKPWTLEGYHPWSWLYWPALADTPFFHEVVRANGMGAMQRLRLWVRWLRRRPAGIAPLRLARLTHLPFLQPMWGASR